MSAAPSRWPSPRPAALPAVFAPGAVRAEPLVRRSVGWFDSRSPVYRLTVSVLLHVTLLLVLVRWVPKLWPSAAGFGGTSEQLGLAEVPPGEGLSTVLLDIVPGPAAPGAVVTAAVSPTEGDDSEAEVTPEPDPEAEAFSDAPLSLPGGPRPGEASPAAGTNPAMAALPTDYLGGGSSSIRSQVQTGRTSSGRPESGADGLEGTGAPEAGGIPGTAFMGLRDNGNRVVFAIDSSGSMTNYNAMRVAKSALISSLQQLGPQQSFQVLFYNDEVQELPTTPDHDEMLFASDINKTRARQFISGVTPDLGTRHFPALTRALSYAPDVLFLLTDANEPQLDAGQLAEIAARNGGVTRIHSIEFGRGPETAGDNWLRRIARQNGGSYRYVDVTRFER